MSPRAWQVLPAVGFALAVAACAGSAQAPPAAAFNPGEAEFARAQGRATVKGQMFLRRNDGVVVYGAGSEARLVPKTPHSEQVIAASFPNASKIRMHLILGIHSGAALNFDPGLAPYVRATKADGNGNFAFQQVPPGTYYVVGNVTWCAPNQGSCDRQGGDLYDTIAVRPTDAEVSAILSGS